MEFRTFMPNFLWDFNTILNALKCKYQDWEGVTKITNIFWKYQKRKNTSNFKKYQSNIFPNFVWDSYTILKDTEMLVPLLEGSSKS